MFSYFKLSLGNIIEVSLWNDKWLDQPDKEYLK